MQLFFKHLIINYLYSKKNEIIIQHRQLMYFNFFQNALKEKQNNLEECSLGAKKH